MIGGTNLNHNFQSIFNVSNAKIANLNSKNGKNAIKINHRKLWTKNWKTLCNKWTQMEDFILLTQAKTAEEKSSKKNWKEISEKIEGKTSLQCFQRWRKLQNFSLKKNVAKNCEIETISCEKIEENIKKEKSSDELSCSTRISQKVLINSENEIIEEIQDFKEKEMIKEQSSNNIFLESSTITPPNCNNNFQEEDEEKIEKNDNYDSILNYKVGDELFYNELTKIFENDNEINQENNSLDSNFNIFNTIKREAPKIIINENEKCLLKENSKCENIMFNLNPHFLKNLSLMHQLGTIIKFRFLKKRKQVLESMWTSLACQLRSKIQNYNIQTAKIQYLRNWIAQSLKNKK